MRIIPPDSSAKEGRPQSGKGAGSRPARPYQARQTAKEDPAPPAAPRHLLRSGVVVEGFKTLERMIGEDRRSARDIRLLIEGTRFDGEKVLEPHANEIETIAANRDTRRLEALIRSVEANTGALAVQAGQDPYPILEKVLEAVRSGDAPVHAMSRERIIDLLG